MAKCGRDTTVWSRIVGYYRPVRNWNRGKQEEFKERTPFALPEMNAPFVPQEPKQEKADDSK